jgi:hypothetical protein
MSTWRELARRKVLQDIWEKLSEEERRTLLLMEASRRDTEDILQAVSGLQGRIDKLAGSPSMPAYFGLDVAANLLTGGLAWLAGRLMKK